MKRKILIALVAVVVILIAVPAVAGLFVDIPFSTIFGLATSPETRHSAHFYPEDTYAYVAVDAKPTFGNIGELLRLRSGFSDVEVLREFFDNMLEGDGTGAGVELEDVSPWIGFRHSAGITKAGAVGIFGARSRDRALEFIPVLIEKGLDAHVSDFTFGYVDGFDTWVPSDDGELPAIALTNDWLVVSTTQRTMHEVLLRMSGGVGTSLLDNPQFAAASGVMLDDHFAAAYLDVTDPDVGSIELIGAFSGLVGEADWVAASAAWIDDGIVLELVMPAGPDYGFEIPGLADSAALVPLGTLAFAAASFDPNLDKWRSALADHDLADTLGMEPDEVQKLLADDFFGVKVEAELGGGEDPTLTDLLDYSLLSISEVLEVDLENEVFGNLSGNVVAGIPDYGFNEAGTMFGATPEEVFVVLSHTPGGGDGLEGTVDGLLDTMGFRPRSIDVGADTDAKTFRLRNFRPTYVLHKGNLAIGSMSGAVEQVVGVQNGEVPRIDSDGEYVRAIEELPEGGNVVVYVGLKDVFARMADASGGNDAEAYGLFADNLASLAAVYGSRAGHTRATLVLTLFPE